MSIFNTKPRHVNGAIPTQSGWVHPITGELLVSVGGLLDRIAQETPQLNPVTIAIEQPIIEEQIMQPEVEVEQPKQKRPYTKKVVGEVTESKLPKGTQLIGEVVEYNLDREVIGE